MTISEVSRKYELSADTLRYYERLGLLPPVGRDSSGNRNYTEEDCNWVQFIKAMRGAGISIETLIDYVRLFQQGESTVAARKQLLTEQYDQLCARVEELRAVQERLRLKIERYEGHVLAYEAKALRPHNG